MYIDVKETIKKYFLVKMKDAYRDMLSLEPISNFKKILKESWLLQMATCGRCDLQSLLVPSLWPSLATHTHLRCN